MAEESLYKRKSERRSTAAAGKKKDYVIDKNADKNAPKEGNLQEGGFAIGDSVIRSSTVVEALSFCNLLSYFNSSCMYVSMII